MSTSAALAEYMAVKTRIKLTGPILAFITTCVKDRIPIFRNRELACLVADQLKEASEYYKASIVGYVLMPSHLHVMLGLKRADLLSRFMQSFKILSSKKIKEVLTSEVQRKFMVGGKFRFWMAGFDDFVVLSEDQFRTKLNYIHNNPVKAGLVKDPADYLFSSASDWLNGIPGLIPIDKEYNWCR